MKTRDIDKAGSKLSSQAALSQVGPRKRRGWVAGVGAFVVVLLVIGASIVVFSVLGQRHGSSQGRFTGQWQQVQQGYLFLSIVAAPSEEDAGISPKYGFATLVNRAAPMDKYCEGN